jgi:hypothetical protein
MQKLLGKNSACRRKIIGSWYSSRPQFWRWKKIIFTLWTHIFNVNQWCLLLVLSCLLYYGENCFKNICGINRIFCLNPAPLPPIHGHGLTELVFLLRFPKIIWFGNKYSGSRWKTHFVLECIHFLHNISLLVSWWVFYNHL